jgi:hypothetical protein
MNTYKISSGFLIKKSLKNKIDTLASNICV